MVNSQSGGIDALVTLELVALSRTKTRLLLSVDMRPSTMSARLLLQSLKFAKANLTRRYKRRVENYCTELQDRYVRSA